MATGAASIESHHTLPYRQYAAVWCGKMKNARVLLERKDWIEAAIDELGVSGFRGLAVEPLARRLHISKGSFYWHFKDLPEVVAAVLEYWKERGYTRVIAQLSTMPDPRQRLVALLQTAWGKPGYLRAEAALVSAALAGNNQVGPVVEEVTTGRLDYLRGAYVELGLSLSEAEKWTLTAYSAYVGLVQLVALRAGRLTTEAEIRALATHLERILIPA